MIYSAEDILKRIQEGTPLSIVRVGDGELIVLNGWEDIEAFKMVLKRQLGYYPPLNECEEIRSNLIKAISECDIIGIPMHENLHELEGYWQRTEEVLNKYVPQKTEDRCSIDIHYDFLEKGYFDKILTKRPVLNYISCRDLEKKIANRFYIKQVNSFTIAPEMKFTSGYKGEKHYPDQFNKIIRWLDKCKIEGQICLIGAGVVGKIYCNWFRDRGGIAIDVGSVFDEFAGLATRGKDRGLDVVKDTKYKL